MTRAADGIDATQTSRSGTFDALRVILVAWIIAGHALLGYSAVGGWAYDEVQEVTLNPRVELVLSALIGPTALFLMGTFFLIAGVFTPASVERKGAARFARERLLRLGLPFVASILVIWPATMWIAYRASGQRVSYGFLLTGRDRLLDSGGLWFAEVLLIFSVGYALIQSGVRTVRTDRAPLTLPGLTCLAALIAVTSFGVRLVLTARGREYLDLHMWQWPQLLAMFLLGIFAARQILRQSIADGLARAAGRITVALLILGPLGALVLGVDEPATDAAPYLGGWTVESALLCVYESSLVVFGSVAVLTLAQRRLRAERPIWHRLRRSSFAAFILQGPVLILLSVTLRPLSLPAEVKACIVVAAGLTCCFSLGWLLVTRTRAGRFV